MRSRRAALREKLAAKNNKPATVASGSSEAEDEQREEEKEEDEEEVAVRLGSLTATPEYLFLLNSWQGNNGPKVSDDFATLSYRAETSGSGSSSGGSGSSGRSGSSGSVSMNGSDQSGLVLGSRGFSRGVHYWEVRLQIKDVFTDWR